MGGKPTFAEAMVNGEVAPIPAKFARDSPLEGAVHCELVSEVKIPAPVTKLGADSGRVMDDSGIVKRCFALEFRRKLSSLPWQPAPHSDN